MNENEFANDALRRIREATKSETDRIGIQLADAIMNIWCQDPKFKETVLPVLSKCPVFMYADIFDAMAKQLTDRFQSEAMWYEIESGGDGN